MSNKVKIILIALEVFALLVLVLLGVGCQQRWIIVTGDGPRFDWYAVQDQLLPSVDKIPGIPDDNPEDESGDESLPEQENNDPETNAPVETRPVQTTPPTTEVTEPEETENTTPPTEDRWSLGEF